jgi:hypothetical protein
MLGAQRSATMRDLPLRILVLPPGATMRDLTPFLHDPVPATQAKVKTWPRGLARARELERGSETKQTPALCDPGALEAIKGFRFLFPLFPS